MEFILKFLKQKDGSINRKFIDLYIKELNKISSEDFLNGFKEKYIDKVEFYNTSSFPSSPSRDTVSGPTSLDCCNLRY